MFSEAIVTSVVSDIIVAMHKSSLHHDFDRTRLAIKIKDPYTYIPSMEGVSRTLISASGISSLDRKSLNEFWTDVVWSFTLNLRHKSGQNHLDLLLSTFIEKRSSNRKVAFYFLLQHQQDPSAIYKVTTDYVSDDSSSRSTKGIKLEQIYFTRIANANSYRSLDDSARKEIVTSELLNDFSHEDKSDLITQIYETSAHADFLDITKLSEQCIDEASNVDYQILCHFLTQPPKAVIEVDVSDSPGLVAIDIEINASDLMNSAFMMHFINKTYRVEIYEILNYGIELLRRIHIAPEYFGQTKPTLRRVFFEALNQYYSLGKVNIKLINSEMVQS